MESLKAITNNTARFAGGYEMKKTFSQFEEEANRPPETRTAEEVKAHLLEKMRADGWAEPDPPPGVN